VLTKSTPEPMTFGETHLASRERLSNRHLVLMEKILEKNAHKEKYWILGWAECKRKNKRTTITPRMQAMDTPPDVTKDSYLYEVDNVAGTRSLLWVMHPNNKLSMPSIGKSISVAG